MFKIESCFVSDWRHNEFIDLTFYDFSCHNFIGRGKNREDKGAFLVGAKNDSEVARNNTNYDLYPLYMLWQEVET